LRQSRRNDRESVFYTKIRSGILRLIFNGKQQESDKRFKKFIDTEV
jgi:hypothetical protein